MKNDEYEEFLQQLNVKVVSEKQRREKGEHYEEEVHEVYDILAHSDYPLLSTSQLTLFLSYLRSNPQHNNSFHITYHLIQGLRYLSTRITTTTANEDDNDQSPIMNEPQNNNNNNNNNNNEEEEYEESGEDRSGREEDKQQREEGMEEKEAKERLKMVTELNLTMVIMPLLRCFRINESPNSELRLLLSNYHPPHHSSNDDNNAFTDDNKSNDDDDDEGGEKEYTEIIEINGGDDGDDDDDDFVYESMYDDTQQSTNTSHPNTSNNNNDNNNEEDMDGLISKVYHILRHLPPIIPSHHNDNDDVINTTQKEGREDVIDRWSEVTKEVLIFVVEFISLPSARWMTTPPPSSSSSSSPLTLQTRLQQIEFILRSMADILVAITLFHRPTFLLLLSIISSGSSSPPSQTMTSSHIMIDDAKWKETFRLSTEERGEYATSAARKYVASMKEMFLLHVTSSLSFVVCSIMIRKYFPLSFSVHFDHSHDDLTMTATMNTMMNIESEATKLMIHLYSGGYLPLIEQKLSDLTSRLQRFVSNNNNNNNINNNNNKNNNNNNVVSSTSELKVAYEEIQKIYQLLQFMNVGRIVFPSALSSSSSVSAFEMFVSSNQILPMMISLFTIINKHQNQLLHINIIIKISLLVDSIFRTILMFHPSLACYISQVKSFMTSISNLKSITPPLNDDIHSGDNNNNASSFSHSDPNHLLESFYYPKMFNQLLFCIITTSASSAASTTNNNNNDDDDKVVTQLLEHHVEYFTRHLPMLVRKSSIICNYFEEFLANLECLLYLPASSSAVSFLGGVKLRIVAQNLLQRWKVGASQITEFVRSFVKIVNSPPIILEDIMKNEEEKNNEEKEQNDEDDGKLKDKKIVYNNNSMKYSSNLRRRLKSLSLSLSPQQNSSKTD